jgi:uncharacterized protein (TIGR03067 family)
MRKTRVARKLSTSARRSQHSIPQSRVSLDQPKRIQLEEMKANSITLSLGLIVLCGFATSSALAGDQEDIQGAWTLQKISMNGKAMPAPAVTYTFTGDTLIIHPEKGADQKTTFKLETSKSKVMVVQHSESAGTKPDRTPYDLSGDTLKIAFAAPDEPSPEVSDNGQILFTLQRKKS